MTFSDVVLLFACDNSFAPYFSVALQSIIEHLSPHRHYDIVVLTNDIEPQAVDILRQQVGQAPAGSVSIGFLDVTEAVEGARLRRHGHFRLQMYFRLLAPDLLPSVDKALYFDSDLIVLADPAELFDTDVTGKLLAATQDADTIGQAMGYDGTVERYLLEEVGAARVEDYFQSGVVVFNLAELRKRCPTTELLRIAGQRLWRWPDQDVLNMAARGDYVRVDMAWNSLFDWERLRRSRIVAQAPAPVRAAFEEAYANPKVVHYAGPDDRPWLYPACDRGDLFWDYAARCPYKAELDRRLHESRTRPRGLLKRLEVAVLYRVGMNLLDAVMRPGSRRRTVLIAAFRSVGGGRII